MAERPSVVQQTWRSIHAAQLSLSSSHGLGKVSWCARLWPSSARHLRGAWQCTDAIGVLSQLGEGTREIGWVFLSIFHRSLSLFCLWCVTHIIIPKPKNSAHTPENWGTNSLANVIISRLPRAFTNVCETLALQWVRGAIEKRWSRSSHRRIGLSRARRLPEMLRGNWVFRQDSLLRSFIVFVVAWKTHNGKTARRN